MPNDKELTELKVFIAEKVMGWKRVDKGPVMPGEFAVSEDGVLIRPHRHDSGPRSFDPIHYKEQALEVLEKCGEIAWVDFWQFKDSKHWYFTGKLYADPRVTESVEVETFEIGPSFLAKQLFS